MKQHPPPGPTQRLYRSLIILIALIAVGLMASVVLVSIQTAQTNRRLSALEDYVQGRGEIRDRENAEMNERIDNAVREGRCDLLDQLPAGGFLDRLRDTFGCGPGIPIEQLPPEIQQRYRTTPTIPAPSSTVPLAPAPPSGSPASPDAPDPVPNKPGAPAAEPSPSPDPLVDLGPTTDEVCDALRVCV